MSLTIPVAHVNAGDAHRLVVGAHPWGYSAAFADPDGHLWQVKPVAAEPLFAG